MKTATTHSMQRLMDRINRVINTHAFDASLNASGVPLFEFQCGWMKTGGNFGALPEPFKNAIKAGEAEMMADGVIVI